MKLKKIAVVYHSFKNEGTGNYSDIAGFCKVATLSEVQEADYKLTPGIYVGTEVSEEDDTPIEEKIVELSNILLEQFEESNLLQEKIRKDLRGLL